MEAGNDGTRSHVTFSTTTPATKVAIMGSPSAVPAGQRKGPTRQGTKRLGVDEQGQFTYKKTPSSTLMASLQLGLQHSIGSIEPKPHRDILMTDFEVVETVDFPAEGSDCTPAHKCNDFTFKTYSPEAMRFFREAFNIAPEDFMLALCDQPLREVSNPGASGSLFYLSADDAFILKTVQKKEARFLQKLLPGYYLNLTQNKRTLLPKFFGLYRYKSGSVNIRIVVMNNLLPSSIRYHEKYDLKGSTYKRKSNESELKKSSPTFKDLDFMERHEEGIILAPEKYEALLYSVERDCKVLESFGIMDYSLLLGIHNIDQAIRTKAEAAQSSGISENAAMDAPIPSRIELSKNYSIVSTEDIPALLAEEQQQRHHYPEGYIQGRIHGDRVMFYLGIIDILQSYRLKKKLEHGFKSFITDGATVSVHNPSFYARRFQDFMTTQVFKKDKNKYRSRKNSTNAQLRGGRRPAPLNKVPERQSSRESPKNPTSPLRDPPSYNQAMKGAGVAATQSPYNNAPRLRSMSESVAASLSTHQAAARVVSQPLRLEPREEGEESRTDGTEDEAEPRTDRVEPSQLDTQPSVDSMGDRFVSFSSDLPMDREPGVTLLRLQNVPDGDFARNVRGTSTPIDSPTPDSSRTYEYEGGAVGGAETITSDESKGDGKGFCETS